VRLIDIPPFRYMNTFVLEDGVAFFTAPPSCIWVERYCAVLATYRALGGLAQHSPHCPTHYTLCIHYPHLSPQYDLQLQHCSAPLFPCTPLPSLGTLFFISLCLVPSLHHTPPPSTKGVAIGTVRAVTWVLPLLPCHTFSYVRLV